MTLEHLHLHLGCYSLILCRDCGSTPPPSSPPSPPLSPFLLSDKSMKKTPYGASKLLVGQRRGGNSINHNIDGARHSSHSVGEGVWVNSSSSNAGSGSGEEFHPH